MLNHNFARLLLSAAVFLTPVAHAREVFFEDWRVDDGGNVLDAATRNSSGSSLQVLCSPVGEADCVFSLHTGAPCDADERTPVLLNGERLASTVHGECKKIDSKTFTLWFREGDAATITAVLINAAHIGFALPMEGGSFKVSRFSARGFKKALTTIGSIREAAAAKKKPDSKSSIRDTTL